MNQVKLIDAIRAQERYAKLIATRPKTAQEKSLKPPKLADHLIVKILIEGYKGRRAPSIAKSMNLKPVTVYNVMRRYLFIRREDGNHTYRRNPNAD